MALATSITAGSDAELPNYGAHIDAPELRFFAMALLFIFGGAVVPLLTGSIADLTGNLTTGLVLPAICYAVIASFAWYARRSA